jgi:hypothetical protein
MGAPKPGHDPGAKAFLEALAWLAKEHGPLAELLRLVQKGHRISELASILKVSEATAWERYSEAIGLVQRRVLEIITNPRQPSVQQTDEANPEAVVRPHLLPPDLKEWALRQYSEAEILAGLQEVRQQKGPELGEIIQELEQELTDREPANS